MPSGRVPGRMERKAIAYACPIPGCSHTALSIAIAPTCPFHVIPMVKVRKPN